ncbi:MAG: phosphatase PAP2 family protein [Ruminococcaceae bacterium]|nr:phosphatase PAP2 family protein [Oscillospiraceae bacterium]
MSPILLAASTLGDKIDSAFAAFDLWVFHFFGSMQCGFLTAVAKIFTTFGDEAFVIPMAVLGVVLCFFKKTRKYGFALIFAIAIGTIVTNVVVKPMALRIRPYNTLQANADYWKWYLGAGMLSESDYSFPSGHTTAAFEIGISMFLVFMSEKKKKIAWIFPCIAVFTMCSRVYLMVHYATDVLCGLVVGSLAGVMAFFLSKLVCKLFEKVKFLDAIDVDRLFKKCDKEDKHPYIWNKIVICVAVAAFFCGAFIPSLTEGGAEAERCAYDEEYDCQNEPKSDLEKYPVIDGQKYCKIHHKEYAADLIYSEDGVITALPELPEGEAWQEGEVDGFLKTETDAKVKLEWNETEVKLTVESEKAQDIKIGISGGEQQTVSFEKGETKEVVLTR